MIILGIELFYLVFGFTEADLSTMSAILLLFIGLLVLYQVCKPFDWKLPGTLGHHGRVRVGHRALLWGSLRADGAHTPAAADPYPLHVPGPAADASGAAVL